MSMITYQYIIIISWAAYILIWVIMSLNVKRDIRGGFSKLWRHFLWIRIIAAVSLIFIAARIATGHAHYSGQIPIFYQGIFHTTLVLGWTGAIITFIGVSFAIWARFHIGRNWSPRPAVKENHELVTSGPYAYVRHPIYTGLLLSAFGTFLTGSYFGLVVLIIALIIFISRIGREEKIMLELFPNDYPEYKKRTKVLIPFIW